MQEDERCCGTGTCLINEQGLCWCGQQWNGAAMCFQPPQPLPDSTPVQSTAGDRPPP